MVVWLTIVDQNPILSSLPAIFSSIWVQAVEGLGIFYAVYKFFKTIDENLNSDASTSLANWILGSSRIEQAKAWPNTFGTIFERIFGSKQLSWICLRRSVLITCFSMILIAPWVVLSRGIQLDKDFFRTVIPANILAGLLPDYLCILITRTSIAIMRRYRSILLPVILLLIVASLNYLISAVTPFWGDEIRIFLRGGAAEGGEPFAGLERSIDVMIGAAWASLFAACASLIWLFLFVASGALLRASRVFRLGFNHFNRAFDIKKKPLACLGMVAGATCALFWWGCLAFIHLH